MANPNTVSTLLNLISRFFSKKIRKVYYSTRESIGEHKREIVVYQVGQACNSLKETKEEFEETLEKFKSLVCVNESALEHRYNLLNRQYQFCRSRSDAVSYKISAIQEVSEALFLEWESELDQYTNRVLRNSSKQQLKGARQNYARLIKTMQRTEAKIQPVLAAFKDQVLYLKHNLNYRAIAALQHEFIEISVDISQLILAMEQTIEEANRFFLTLGEEKAIKQKSLTSL